MWARANILAGALAVAVLLGGCAAVGVSTYSASSSAEMRSLRKAPLMTIDHADAEFHRAVALIGELRYQEAISTLAVQEGVAVSTNRIARAAECAFWHGYCREKLGDPRQAEDIYRALIDTYPRTPAAAQAARRLTALEARTREPADG